MSVESMDRVAVCCSQLHNHSGPYYDKWLTYYKQSLRHSQRIAKAKGLSKNWYKGMKKAVKRLEKERNDNT